MELKGNKEKIAQLLAEGKKAKEIIEVIGLSGGYTKNIMKEPKVVKRALEIKKENKLKDLDILSYEDTLQTLSEIIRNEEETTPNKIKAIEALQKLRNDNKTIRGLTEEGIPENLIRPVIIQIPSNNRDE